MISPGAKNIYVTVDDLAAARDAMLNATPSEIITCFRTISKHVAETDYSPRIAEIVNHIAASDSATLFTILLLTQRLLSDVLQSIPAAQRPAIAMMVGLHALISATNNQMFDSLKAAGFNFEEFS